MKNKVIDQSRDTDATGGSIEQGAYNKAFNKMENAYMAVSKHTKKRRPLTTSADDLIYLCGWIFIAPLMILAGWNFIEVLARLPSMGVGMGTVAIGFNLAYVGGVLLAWLFLIGVRLLMKIAGHLRHIEDLLAHANEGVENE